MLVIVDMQSGFEAGKYKQTIENIVDLIERAIALDDDICILEYIGAGPTIKSIMKAVKDYPKLSIVSKCEDDGAWDIAEEYGFNDGDNATRPERVDICGINYSYCVTRTAIGLIGYGIDTVVVHARACNQHCDWVTTREECTHEYAADWLRSNGCSVVGEPVIEGGPFARYF